MDKHDIWQLIAAERQRQDRLHPKVGTDHHLLAVLMEEVGEVAQAIQEKTNLHEELVHVAAVAIRWLENRE